MKRSEFKKYDRLAQELINLGDSTVHFGPGYDDVKLHKACKKAAHAIRELLLKLELGERQPMGPCPLDGVCQPLNNTRKVVVNLVEALISDDSENETIIFSALEDGDHGKEV